jgi:hypothetical protein
MIALRIPTSARYLCPSQSFFADFNVDLDGKYNFSIQANQNKLLMELKANTAYIFSVMDIGGNVSEEKYLDSIDVMPQIVFSRRLKDEFIYRHPIPIVNFSKNSDISAFLTCDQIDDLLVSFNGRLTQTADLVGKLTVKIFIKLHMHAIEGTHYITEYMSDPANPEKIKAMFR